MTEPFSKAPTQFYPLGVYRGLDAGPNWGRTTSAASSDAIDGTKQRLRDARLGSPFTFRITPPSILLDALLGGGGARTRSVFDPLLREVFDEAEKTLFEVQAAFEAGRATVADVEAARQGLMGGRAPAGQNLGIIEAATRSKNNFAAVLDQRQQFKQSNFFATGPGRGTTLTQLEDLVASNGVRFNPRNVSETQANQAAVSDLSQALDVILQLNKVLVTPPLTLLINPEELQIVYTKKQVYQDRNRYNFIFQSWGEEQPVLSVSGRSAGFVAGAGGNTQLRRENRQNQQVVAGLETASVSGYQYASKWDSAAWQNLMALFTFYRNNGYVYNTAGRPRSEAHLFIGNIEIAYDQWVYLGNFENFQYQYEENKQQGSVAFSFEFVVSFMYDRAQNTSVRPISGPTPSPSAARRGGTPFITDPQVKATASMRSVPESPSSTAILDSLIDPFDTQGLRPPGSRPSNPFVP